MPKRLYLLLLLKCEIWLENTKEYIYNFLFIGGV